MTEQLTAMTVASVMTRDPVAVSPHSSFKDIVELIADRGLSAVPVVSATGIVVGVVSEADLLRNRQHGARRPGSARPRDAGRLTAVELMTSPAVTVSSDTTLGRAGRVLADCGRRQLFVVDEGRLVGVLARRDVLSVLRRPDKEICAEIEREVFERLAAPAQSVRVSVNAGVVLLTGQLPGRGDIESAMALIDEIPGVIDIKDRLLCGFEYQPHVRW
jgi:CBS domain-containing protein